MTDGVGMGVAEPAYGRFSRRLRAVVIDWMIVVSLLVAALFAAVLIRTDQIGRILGFTFVAIWLLYEPLLVSFTGSTIGHYRTNLRVVDNRTHGNIGFVKAVARVIVKGVFGLYSFVTMAMTSRHQAVHDLLTRSTVQIRDRSKAGSQDFVGARTELLNPGMPSVGRRILVIVGYLAATYVLVAFITAVFTLSGLISHQCLARNQWCSASERSALSIIGFGVGLCLIAAAVFCIVQGWRGRLYGCRIRDVGLRPNNNQS